MHYNHITQMVTSEQEHRITQEIVLLLAKQSSYTLISTQIIAYMNIALKQDRKEGI